MAVIVAAGIGFAASSAYTASNTVPATNIGQYTHTIGANDLKPAACASLTLTHLILGGTTSGSGSDDDLVLGTSGGDKITESNGGGGGDCLIGGLGTDTLTGVRFGGQRRLHRDGRLQPEELRSRPSSRPEASVRRANRRRRASVPLPRWLAMKIDFGRDEGVVVRLFTQGSRVCSGNSRSCGARGFERRRRRLEDLQPAEPGLGQLRDDRGRDRSGAGQPVGPLGERDLAVVGLEQRLEQLDALQRRRDEVVDGRDRRRQPDRNRRER